MRVIIPTKVAPIAHVRRVLLPLGDSEARPHSHDCCQCHVAPPLSRGAHMTESAQKQHHSHRSSWPSDRDHAIADLAYVTSSTFPPPPLPTFPSPSPSLPFPPPPSSLPPPPVFPSSLPGLSFIGCVCSCRPISGLPAVWVLAYRLRCCASHVSTTPSLIGLPPAPHYPSIFSWRGGHPAFGQRERHLPPPAARRFPSADRRRCCGSPHHPQCIRLQGSSPLGRAPP